MSGRSGGLTRRACLAGLGLVAGLDRAVAGASEPLRDAPAGRDRLWLMRPDGSEVLSRFRTAEGYDRTQILLLSWFMRDIRDDDRAVWMEPRLFDLLAGVQASMSAVHGSALPLVVTSGYRTPQHNAALENAARGSMHLYGYAADVQVRGYPPRAVALAASFFSPRAASVSTRPSPTSMCGSAGVGRAVCGLPREGRELETTGRWDGPIWYCWQNRVRDARAIRLRLVGA